MEAQLQHGTRDTHSHLYQRRQLSRAQKPNERTILVISRDSQIDHVWNLADKIGACMLVTISGHGMRARPMHALPDREAGCLWFITDQHGAKDDEIKAAPDVCLAFADTGSNSYLSITGRAEVLHDIAKATAIWSDEAQAWWPKGPADPEVRVLRVIPENAEYWDTRGNSIMVALKLTAARVSGRPPDLGENRKVQMR
jgi:general stress protein 26